ncbi:phosphatase PAP2 family protein [Geomicrobium sp. JSM 1781026]|uniref:phosphatase PAP2 family protein n=1 Tax=Geomicrobium sp. JSM 1781026 TaxID=3344580 RepID=UPI0035C1866A
MGKRMIGVLLLALSTIGFTFLMLPVGQWLDETILRALQPIHSGEEGEGVYRFFEVVTHYGDSLFFMIFFVLLFLYLMSKREWMFMLFSTVYLFGGVALNTVLKQIIQRERPGGLERTIDFIGEPLNLLSYSFPSGHSFRAVMISILMIYLIKQVMKWGQPAQITAGVVLVILALLTVVSRVILGVHFPTDVIMATIYSIVWFVILLLIMNMALSVWNKREKRV